MNIPIYRAKKIDSEEYVEGYLKEGFFNNNECLWIQTKWKDYIIDASTLAIHFPDMLDIEGNKIFAGLSEDGKGGDIVIGKCRDGNGDTMDLGCHKPFKYKGIVRFYKETTMNVVIETIDRVAEETKDWLNPIVLERGSALRWSDCRHSIYQTGIQA